MSGLPADWLFEELKSLRGETKERHERLRSDMTAGFDKIGAKIDQHAEDDRKVEARVAKIEVQREEEAKQGVKRGAVAGILASSGILIIWEAIQKVIGWR